MKIIVFGGAGFLGSHVADTLTDAGYDVVIFDRQPSQWLRTSQKMIVGDVLDQAAVMDAIDGCEVVYNFAAIGDIGEANEFPIDSARINILGNIQLLEACAKYRIKRYVFGSTMYVYSRTGGAYRCSKQACESYIEHYHFARGQEYTILRYGSLYGPRSNMRNGIHRFIHEAISEGSIEYHGSSDALREHIHVFDAAKASVEILTAQFANQHVILSGNQVIRMADLFRMISEILGKKISLSFLSDGASGHYETTPYSFTPKIGIKYAPNPHIDLGQGLLMKIDELFPRVTNGA